MADRELTLPSRTVRLRRAVRGLGLADFWQWWRGQLEPLVPTAFRSAVARRQMRPVVAFEGDRATLWLPGVEAGAPVMRVAATIPLATDPGVHATEGRAVLATHGREARLARVVVSLAPSSVLRKRIVLPAALEENLRQALAYDLDRHTPFKPEELYFDAVVIERARTQGTVTVDLAAARRSVVDPILRHVAAWGAEVAAVVPDPPAGAARAKLNLLPTDARTELPLVRRWQFWLPLVAIVAAVAAAVIVPLWQQREAAIALGHEADAARAQAAVSETLRAQVDAQVNDFNFALERKYAYPSALAVLDTVSRLLPDDTWLTQFELKSAPRGKDVQREIMLRGETANAAKLVQLFEESQLFAQAAQRGPTTKIQPGPGEIFDLGAQLRPRPVPAAVRVAVGRSATPSGTPEPAAPAPGAGAATDAAGTPPPGTTRVTPAASPSMPVAPPSPSAAPSATAPPATAGSTAGIAPMSPAASAVAPAAAKASGTPPPSAVPAPAPPPAQAGASTTATAAAPGAAARRDASRP